MIVSGIFVYYDPSAHSCEQLHNFIIGYVKNCTQTKWNKSIKANEKGNEIYKSKDCTSRE